MKEFDLDDIPANESETTPFHELVEAAQSRRGFLKAGLGLGVISFFGLGVTDVLAKTAANVGNQAGSALGMFNPEEIKNFAGFLGRKK